MHSVTLEEAQTHLFELITHLQPGETVEIMALLNEGMNFKVPLLQERDLGRGQSREVTEPT
jgi:hypothetical protein